MSSTMADQYKVPPYMSLNAGWGGDLRGLNQWVQLYIGAQINFGDLTPYLAYGCDFGIGSETS